MSFHMYDCLIDRMTVMVMATMTANNVVMKLQNDEDAEIRSLYQQAQL